MAELNHDKQVVSGFVLISVLWFVALMTVIATGLSYLSRQSIHSISGMAGGTEARYVADGAAQLVIANLMTKDRYDRLLADGDTLKLSLPGGEAEVLVFDESGKIDINNARSDTLSRLISSFGVEREVANAIADSILDFRDKDKLKRVNGAEDEEYLAAGFALGAKNDAFSSVEELQRVYGMEPEIYAAIAPYVTVYGFKMVINPEVAPLQVLLAVSDEPESSLVDYVERRRMSHHGRLPMPAAPNIERWMLAKGSRNIYTLISSGITDSGKRGGTTTTVRLRRSRLEPVVTRLDWRPYIYLPGVSDFLKAAMVEQADGRGKPQSYGG